MGVMAKTTTSLASTTARTPEVATVPASSAADEASEPAILAEHQS
jgi:hypothetical protein